MTEPEGPRMDAFLTASSEALEDARRAPIEVFGADSERYFVLSYLEFETLSALRGLSLRQALRDPNLLAELISPDQEASPECPENY